MKRGKKIQNTKGPASRHTGFTLIELLFVISIISLLASIVLASVGTARNKARDAFRVSSMHAIQSALELYYTDHGAYPFGTAYSVWSTPGRCTSLGFPADTANWKNCDDVHGDPMGELLRGGYLRTLPQDPMSHEDYMIQGYPNAVGFYYCSGSPRGNCPTFASGNSYSLGTNLEYTNKPNTIFGNYVLQVQ